MSGPCLCGDPYCGSCGNPEQAAMDEKFEEFVDELYEIIHTYEEMEFIKSVTSKLLEEFRAQVANRINEIRVGDMMEIDCLQLEVKSLKAEIKQLRGE